MTDTNPHLGQPARIAGALLSAATAAVIMLHGRGANAEDILALSGEFDAPQTIFLAPQAAGNTWYPYSFLSPLEQNEPHLASALAQIDDLLKMLQEAGISAARTMLLGFSQGACLALEYAARNARHYGGIAGLSGGLIGPDGTSREYSGFFDNTPVFLGCSEHDPHIPAPRVVETEQVLARMGARVTRRFYPHLGHTINRDELAEVQRLITALTDS